MSDRGARGSLPMRMQQTCIAAVINWKDCRCRDYMPMMDMFGKWISNSVNWFAPGILNRLPDWRTGCRRKDLVVPGLLSEDHPLSLCMRIIQMSNAVRGRSSCGISDTERLSP